MKGQTSAAIIAISLARSAHERHETAQQYSTLQYLHSSTSNVCMYVWCCIVVYDGTVLILLILLLLGQRQRNNNFTSTSELALFHLFVFQLDCVIYLFVRVSTTFCFVSVCAVRCLPATPHQVGWTPGVGRQ